MAASSRVKGDTLDAVFSLLSSGNAARAKREIRERLQAVPGVDTFYIHWAEFELSGKFVRGGISDVSELETVVITNSQSDPNINLLARRAAAGGLTAGLVEWDRECRSLLWFAPFRHLDPTGGVHIRLRGMVIADLKVEILREGVHSGDAGGVVPDTFRILRRLLDRIEDPDTGELTLPETRLFPCMSMNVRFVKRLRSPNEPVMLPQRCRERSTSCVM